MPSPTINTGLPLLPRGDSAFPQRLSHAVNDQPVSFHNNSVDVCSHVVRTESSVVYPPAALASALQFSQSESDSNAENPLGASQLIASTKRVIRPNGRHDGEKLLIQFLERYLQITFQGCQPGYGRCDDLILFAGGRDSQGRASTLAVPGSILLLPHQQAKDICQQKIEASERAFSRNGHH